MKRLNSFEEIVDYCDKSWSAENTAGYASGLLIENLTWQDHDWSAYQSPMTDLPSGAMKEVEIDVCLFRSSSFRNVSFRGFCLTGLAFYQCDFQDCRFDSADLREVVFEHCNFYVSDQDIVKRLGPQAISNKNKEEDVSEEKHPTSFKFANLTCTHLSSSDLSLCNFTRSKLYRTEIKNCQVQGADFSETGNNHSPGGSVTLHHAVLVDNNFAYTDFTGATFKEADLSGNRFSHCIFHHAILDHSQMNECDMHAIEAESLSLVGADLRGCNISGIDPRTVDFTNAMINASQQSTLLEALGLIIDTSLDVD